MNAEHIDSEVARFKSFDEFKKSDKYKKLYDSLVKDYPDQKEYFHDIALCSYWHDHHLYSLSPEERRTFKKQQKKLAKKAGKLEKYNKHTEQKAVESYSPDEHLEKFGELKVKNSEGEEPMKIIEDEVKDNDEAKK